MGVIMVAVVFCAVVVVAAVVVGVGVVVLVLVVLVAFAFDAPIVDPPLQAKARAMAWLAKDVEPELVFFVVEEVFLPDHELELGWEARKGGKG